VPVISAVNTSAAQFGVSGVPLKQPLSVSWKSDTTLISNVDILLQRSAWSVPQYIALGVANTNAYTWTVGNVLLSQAGIGISAGSDYAVLVWDSKTSHGASTAFSVANPCAYVT